MGDLSNILALLGFKKESIDNGWSMAGVFLGLYLFFLLIALLISIFILYRIIHMFYNFSDYKYNLLVILILIIIINLLDYLTKIDNSTIMKLGNFNMLIIIILSYFPFSNSGGSKKVSNGNNAYKNK